MELGNAEAALGVAPGRAGVRDDTVDARRFDPDCPFCQIALGQDQSVEIVAEHESWIAFLPDAPATLGHTLVIPRAHYRDLWSLPLGLSADLMSGVIAIGKAIERGVVPAPLGMNLISSAGSVAAQSVFHVHLHVVPRRPRDRIGRIWPPKRLMSNAKQEGLAEQIRRAYAAGT